jgi:hypothetical protein
MITLQNTKDGIRRQFKKAIAKCLKVRPRVLFVRFGLYEVSNSKGSFYTVAAAQNATGQREIVCECEGAKRGLVCYHAGAALAVHTAVAQMRRQTA